MKQNTENDTASAELRALLQKVRDREVDVPIALASISRWIVEIVRGDAARPAVASPERHWSDEVCANSVQRGEPVEGGKGMRATKTEDDRG